MCFDGHHDKDNEADDNDDDDDDADDFGECYANTLMADYFISSKAKFKISGTLKYSLA